MKTLKLSTVATILCLLCMSMGFPNLTSEEEKDQEQCSKKKTRATDVRTAALGCSRQVSVAEKPVKGNKQQEPFNTACTAKSQMCSTISAKACPKKNV